MQSPSRHPVPNKLKLKKLRVQLGEGLFAKFERHRGNDRDLPHSISISLTF